MGYLDNQFSVYDEPQYGETVKVNPKPSSDERFGVKEDVLSAQALALLDSASVTGITSREDIIDPYSIIKIENYRNTARGRALYESDLARAIEIQKQQLASYEEWYNSPAQSALRERQAGINPDIAGLDNAGAAAQTSPASSVPGQNLPTSGQIASNIISSITSIIGSLSSVASLATAFTTLPLNVEQTKNAKKVGEQLDLQNEMLGLQNDSQLGTMIAADISDLLATAQQAHIDSESKGEFDLDGFFANDRNFDSLSAVYGSNPRYASLLAKQRKAVLSHQKRAAEAQSGLASANWSLGNIISDPRYSGDQKLTMIQLRPFVDACVKADSAEVALRESVAKWQKSHHDGLDVKLAIDAANAANRASFAQSRYTDSYYNEADGELVAAYEQFVRSCLEPSYEMQRLINTGYVDLFNSDPSGEAASKAAYLFGSNGGSSWEEVYWIRNEAKFSRLVDADLATAEATGDTAKLHAFIKALDGIMTLNEYRTDPSIDFVLCVKKTRQKIEDAIKVLESFE